MSLFNALVEIERTRRMAALCTIIKISGSTPRKPGAKMIVIDNHQDFGVIEGSIGGGAIEHHIRRCAIRAIRAKKAELITTSLRNELGMCCGGEMTVFIEPIAIKPRLVCFGAGHIAQALCPMAHVLGFDASVVDERSELLAHEAFAKTRCVYARSAAFSVDEIEHGDDAFVVIATHDHDLDQRIVESVINHQHAYLALVGSRRKAEMTKKRLRAKAFTEDAIARLICPAGLSIGADTPQEIALAIAAQMVEVRNESVAQGADSRGRQKRTDGDAKGAHATCP